jgi:hypothetical protein
VNRALFAAVAIEAYAVCARRTERRDVHVAEALGGAAEGSYEQEAAAVEEDEVVGREDERGAAKRPDLNKLDVPESPYRGGGGTACSRGQSAGARWQS